MYITHEPYAVGLVDIYVAYDDGGLCPERQDICVMTVSGFTDNLYILLFKRLCALCPEGGIHIYNQHSRSVFCLVHRTVSILSIFVWFCVMVYKNEGIRMRFFCRLKRGLSL